MHTQPGRAVARASVVVAVVALSVATATAEGQETRTRIAGRSVVVWMPASTAEPAPLIVFSHGFGGCARQSTFLTEALARAGYVVVAPNHRDARCSRGPTGAVRPTTPFRLPQRWSDSSYRDRAEDVRAIVAALRDSVPLRGRVDVTRIGLVGHSLGGYTVLGLGGAWPSWRLPNVRAVLALSPFADPFLVHRTLHGITPAVMYQTGTRDVGINPSLKRSSGVYDLTPAPKYYLELEGAGHSAWTVLRDAHHASITTYSVAFLDHYVRGKRGAGVLTQAGAEVSQLRYRSELGDSTIRNERGRARRF